MRYKAKTKDCHLIVRVKTSFRESIDEKSLDAFARIYLRGFLKPRVIKKNYVEYAGPVGISLYDRLKTPITKHDFLFVMEQIVVAVQKIQANGLSLDNLILDLHYVYINEVTKEIQFLYVPINQDRESVSIGDFAEAVVYSVIPADEKDKEYLSRFVYFLKGLNGFDPEKIEKYIAREDRSIINTIKKQNVGQSGFMTSKPQHYYDHYDEKQADFDEATALLAEEDEATGLLEDDATGILEGDATSLLVDGDDEGTALLVENMCQSYPYLFRVSKEENISINKSVFRLGKEKSYVDYVIADNNAVSRSHADIITRGKTYFVIDLNSKNHTYINDQLLPVQVETEIFNGDRLRLGNEDFIFNT